MIYMSYVKTDSKKNHAIGYFRNKDWLCSFPAKLNGNRIPSLQEASKLLKGAKI